MLIDYRNKDVRRLCEDAQFARKKYPDKIVTSIGQLVYKLSSFNNFETFKNNPASKKYNIHNLQGTKKDLISLYLDRKYRMTVKLKIEQNKIIIWEISNHYGD